MLNVGNLFRVVKRKDIVPHIPACRNFIGLGRCRKDHWLLKAPYHAPQEIWYKPKDFSEYKECSTFDGEDTSCSNRYWIHSSKDHYVYFGINLSNTC